MEDINNALLHIKAKYNGEIPYKYGSNECAKLMDSYAKGYHESKLKLLGISIVSGIAEHQCGNQITEKELFHEHCLKCGEYLSED